MVLSSLSSLTHFKVHIAILETTFESPYTLRVGGGGCYVAVSLASVPGKLLEQILKGPVYEHLKDNLIQGRQHRFVFSRSSQP